MFATDRILPHSYAATRNRTHISSVAPLLRDLYPGCFTDWATAAAATKLSYSSIWISLWPTNLTDMRMPLSFSISNEMSNATDLNKDRRLRDFLSVELDIDPVTSFVRRNEVGHELLRRRRRRWRRRRRRRDVADHLPAVHGHFRLSRPGPGSVDWKAMYLFIRPRMNRFWVAEL